MGTNGEVPGAGVGVGIVWRALCKWVLAQIAGVTCKICLKMDGVKTGSGDCWFLPVKILDKAVELFQEPAGICKTTGTGTFCMTIKGN